MNAGRAASDEPAVGGPLGRIRVAVLVAEGVEDQDTWTALAAAGCDVVQGYFLSEPLPAEEIVAWLGDRAAAHA